MLGPLERSQFQDRIRNVPDYKLDTLEDNLHLNGQFDAMEVVNQEKSRRAAIREDELRRDEEIRSQEGIKTDEELRGQDDLSTNNEDERQTINLSIIRMGDGNMGWECNKCGTKTKMDLLDRDWKANIDLVTADILGLVDWQYNLSEDSWAYDQHAVIECDNCDHWYIAFTD